MKKTRMGGAFIIALVLSLLPAFSLAVTVHDITGLVPDPNQNNDLFLLQPVRDGDTITGTAVPCRLIQVLHIEENAAVYLNNVSIPQGNLELLVENFGPVRLILRGNVSIHGQPTLAGLEVFGKLVISEKGSLDANGITALSGFDAILPEYSGAVPAGMHFAGWQVAIQKDNDYSITMLQAGERLQSNTLTQIFPMFVPLPPETGDDCHIVFWYALVAISVIGMVTLVRKRKEA